MNKYLLILLILISPSLFAQDLFIQNPSLEKADGKNPALPLGFPDYLLKSRYAKVFKWTDSVANKGKKSLSFEMEGDSAGFNFPVADLETGKLYKFSFSYRTNIDDYQTNIIRISGKGDKKSISFYYPSVTKWTTAEVFFKALVDKGSVGFNVSAFEQGYEKNKTVKLKGFIDDFVFHRLTKEDFFRKNLVQNGDFEDEPISAPGWMFQCANSNVKLQIDTDNPYTGKQCVRLDYPAGKRAHLYSVELPFKGGGFYRLTYAVRASGQARGGYFGLTFNGRSWRHYPVLTTNWQKFSFILEMPNKRDGLVKRYYKYWGYRKKYAGDEFLSAFTFSAKYKKDVKVWIDNCTIKMISDKPLLD